MFLYDNLLEGTIPTEVGLMTDLKSFGVGRNELTGELPSEISELKELSTCMRFRYQLPARDFMY